MMPQSFLLPKLLTACVLLSFISGCGPADTIRRAHLTGMVTFNGEPVEKGSIQFVPLPGVEGSPVKLMIENGRYDSSKNMQDTRGIPIGKNRIEILAPTPTGKQVKNMMGEMEDELVQIIPAKYNRNSELELEVQAGKHEQNFELTP